jgi:hypothetical protein
MEDAMEVYDILAAGDTYQDHSGKQKRRYATAGVAFDPKDGGPGMNCEVHKGIAITGSFIIRKRKTKPAAGSSITDHGFEDDGADFLE